MSDTLDEAGPGEDLQQQPTGDAVPVERLGRAKAAQRGYYRWLRLSRLALGAFVVAALVFIAWLMPWLPGGLDSSDFTPKTAFTLYLLGGATFIGMLALSFRELARRDREGLLVWASVYDEATGLHNRTYLFDRLALECERAQRSERPFTLLLIKIRLAEPGSDVQPALTSALHEKLADLINSVTHSTDVVALLSPGELALLAFGVSRENRKALEDRLRATVQLQLPRSLSGPVIVDVNIGAATLGVDGSDPSALVQAARTDSLLAVRRHQAAA